MDAVFAVIMALLALVGLAATWNWTGRQLRGLRRRLRDGREETESGGATLARTDHPHEVLDPAGRQTLARAREVAGELAVQHGDVDLDQLARDERFVAMSDRLADAEVQPEIALLLARSSQILEAALGLTALARRSSIPAGWTDRGIRSLRRCTSELEPFVYGVLLRHAEYPVIGPALTQIDEGISWSHLARFIGERNADGEQVTVEALRRNVARRLADDIERFVDQFEDELGPAFRGVFEEWRQTTIDTEFLAGFARVWDRPFDSPPARLVGRRRELVELILAGLEQAPRRSVLLVGEQGVGRTAIARAALERLPSTLIVFEAAAAQVHAGAVYVGELETRVMEIAERLKGQSAIWVFPQLEEALYTGQHSRSPQGLLDALLPHIESGEVTIIGEVTPTAYEQLLAERPRIAGAFEMVRVRPLDESESIEVAVHALEHGVLDVEAAEATLSESFELAQQFLPGLAAPGNLLRLVEATAAEAVEQGRRSFDTADVLATIAAASGLPLAMLDPNQPISLDEVGAFFSSRVLGQPEAVEAVVDRIAMAKAGLTDPTRPLGVLLFVGPTGTGKTEIAKALAEFMFGSASRLVRLDMSEYQTPDALERLLADTSTEGHGANLISAVRKDPFAVILLDEFEKAAPAIWDLFLQVFDDGRLTDQQGRTADFRRCVIILTSNVGSSIATRAGVGFSSVPESFRPDKVLAELRRSFRPEFLNRIDRIVVFHPFKRAQMRALLDKELREVLVRRGLRGRPWAVELDESAYAFLIEEGFTPELGARPLKRAVEQHLLAPLAAAIVEQKVPEGDQFLLVGAAHGRGLEVTFVDPDAPAVEPGFPAAEEELSTGRTAPYDLRSVALFRRDDPRAARFLLDELARLGGTIRADSLQDRKRAALRAINEPGFWETITRFETLAEAEYLDRLDAALTTAERLGERLVRQAPRNGTGARDLIALLANRLYVLDMALVGLGDGAPHQVFLGLRPAAGAEDRADANSFAEQLASMYAQWAKRRGMRLEELARRTNERLFTVVGLGSGVILAPEAGLHVLEVDEERSGGKVDVRRISAVVQVAPWAAGPEQDNAAIQRLASDVFARLPLPATVVRRYRIAPSPLVRDAARGYRTGRADRVLAGDFDLF